MSGKSRGPISWLPFWFACAVVGVAVGQLSIHLEVVTFLAIVAVISALGVRRGVAR